MSRVANREIPRLVRYRDDFETNNSTVFTRRKGGRYCVYSYGEHFPMAVYDGKWFVNKDKYSPTTSRHQSLVSQALCGSVTTRVDTKCLQRIADDGFEKYLTERIGVR